MQIRQHVHFHEWQLACHKFVRNLMTLPVQVTFRNMEEEGLEEYIREQAAKLERYYRGITSCRVVVEMRGRHQKGNLYHVRIDLGVPGGELLVKHEPSIHGSLQDKTVTKRTKSTEVGVLHKNAQRAILDAFSEMRRRLQDFARKQDGLVKERAEPLANATVASLFPQEDHGFLATPDGRQIYFHRASVLNGHFDRLRIGSAVRFAEETGEKRSAGEHGSPCSPAPPSQSCFSHSYFAKAAGAMTLGVVLLARRHHIGYIGEAGARRVTDGRNAAANASIYAESRYPCVLHPSRRPLPMAVNVPSIHRHGLGSYPEDTLTIVCTAELGGL